MYKSIEHFFQSKASLSHRVEKSVPSASDHYFKLLTDFEIGLNKNQQEAVRTTDGPFLIVAGASITTATTTHIGYIVREHKIEPALIPMVTYIEKLSNEVLYLKAIWE